MTEVEEIMNSLKRNKFIVYGAGGHAEKFIKVVKKEGLENNFLGTAISKRNLTNPINKCIEDIDKNKLIIIAAHDRNSAEMESNLIRLGFRNYKVIYPYMTEICFGEPYKKNVTLDVDVFLKECQYANYLAIYYLAIECADKKNSYGKNMYLKVMGMSSEVQTAQNRWNEIIKRTNNYRKTKEPEKYPIKVNVEQKYILDGFHRMALAKYFHIRTLNADLFKTELEEYNSMTFKCMWNDKDLNRYFSNKEKEKITLVRKKIFGQDI